MTHVPKELWPQAFQEAKNMSQFVLGLNREMGRYTKTVAKNPPTDRELTLAAAIEIFWTYRLSEEGAHAFRKKTISQAVQFIDARLKRDTTANLQNRNLLKKLRKIEARQEGAGFLAMWHRLELFLKAAQQPDYWKNFEDPTTAIRALAEDLEAVAHQGEEKDGTRNASPGEDEESTATAQAESGTSGAESPAPRGAGSAEGDSHQTESSAGAGTLGESGSSG